MGNCGFALVAWLIFLAAAVLEVGGDAVIRKGLRSGGWMLTWVGVGIIVVGGLVIQFGQR